MPEPTYDELAASHAQLLDQQDEWRREIKEQGAELEQARRERDSLGRRCAVRFGEAEEARAESSQLRDERDAALAEVARLRKLIEPLREWRALWHPDSTPYPQERALIAAVDAHEDHIGEDGGDVPVESAPAAKGVDHG